MEEVEDGLDFYVPDEKLLIQVSFPVADIEAISSAFFYRLYSLLYIYY